ncbi:serine hydrolase [Methylosinus sp. KRF6]|uniref:serine hydrolase domain-containing protein n=1 Tax=Methylosinus sp. KRF6 TaxID=2846853 RepID=UPI001C0B7863|nr:serine hydrolase domain-containing protein [Methylosinus sp. KRF6]MBU3888729.1 beta-lactamase family protein [Methylosinus sp. KRF6]
MTFSDFDFRLPLASIKRRAFLNHVLSMAALAPLLDSFQGAAATVEGARSQFDQTAAYVEEQIPKLLDAIPGIAVALVTRDQVYLKGFGVKKQGLPAPIGPHTTFSLQSISKLYTATAVLRAYEQGVVGLDEPLSELIPGFTVRSRYESNPEKKITLRHLLSHTAGFTHEAPVGNNYFVGNKSFAEHVASIGDSWLRFPVGERYEYSNLGVDLAGFALALRYKTSLDGVFDELLYRPLGLQRTSVDFSRIIPDADRAVGHDSFIVDLPVKVPMDAAGGVYTSVEDAAKFLQAHLRGTLIRSDTAKLMAQPPFPASGQEFGYGLGLSAFTRRGNYTLGHGGGGFGFLTHLYWLPDHGVGVVLLTNGVAAANISAALGVVDAVNSYRSELLERLAGAAPHAPPTPRPADVDVGILARYAGVYIGRASALEFYVEGGTFKARLYSQFQEQKPRSLPLTILSPASVWLDRGPAAEGWKLSFSAGTGGRPPNVVSVGDGSVWLRDSGEPIPEGIREALRSYLKDYVVRLNGVEVAKMKLQLDGAYLKLSPCAGAPSAILTHFKDLLFFTSHGEALDLGGPTPTYANILLEAA